MTQDKFRIKIHSGDVFETLEFPIRPTNAVKGLLVEFESVNAWVWKDLFEDLRFIVFRSKTKYCLESSLEAIPSLISCLRTNMQDELVPVKKSGKGPTEKSHKFKIEILRETFDHGRDPNKPEYELYTKTMTLGWFGVTEIAGEFFARRKMIEEKFDKGHILPKGKRALRYLERLIQAAAERVATASAARAAEKQRAFEEGEARYNKNRTEEKIRKAAQEAQKIESLLPVVAKDGNAAIAFCKRHYTLTDMQRKLKNSFFTWDKLPDAPLQPETLELKDLELLDAIIKLSKSKIKLPDKIIEGATVKWVDWIGPSSKRVRQEDQCEGCTVRFYGVKRVIIFPDGDDITKMEGPNLQIIGGKEVKASI